MKQEIQLYINGQRADLFNDETIQVTSSIQNVRDIGKVFTDFSQTFTLPASQANNKIFQHYYDSDLIITDTSGFDARFKADAVIEINYQPFREGKIKLEGVDLKDNAPYAYKVTFFGNTVNLKDLLGEDLLDSLDLTDYDVAYNPSTIETALSAGIDKNGITDAIVCPLISAQERWFFNSSFGIAQGNLASSSYGGTWTSLKYAIRMHCLILAIEDKYGIDFSTDFFNSSNANWYGLYMWLHREKGAITTATNEPVLLEGFEDYDGYYGVTVENGGSRFDFTDTGGIDNVAYKNRMIIVVDSASASFRLRVKDSGSLIYTSATLTGATSYDIILPEINTNTYREHEIEPDNSFDVISTATNPVTHTYYKVTRFENGSSLTPYEYALDTDVSVTDVNFTVISDNVPKMKIIDFLNAIFKMFNLTAYERGGIIYVKTLASFYAAGTSYDITEYVDMNQSSVSPSTLFKQIDFQYGGLGTLLAVKHKEQFNLDWGTDQYALSAKYDGQVYDVTVPFEHMKYERIINQSPVGLTTVQWGWMVDKVNTDGTGSPYIGLPVVFYPVTSSGNNIYIYNGSTRDVITSYFVPSNSVSLSSATDSSNINFKAELNEYEGELFEGTLFDEYYSDYIEGVFNAQTRITKVTAYLPIKVLTQYKPEDTFIVGDRAYKINSVTSNLSDGRSEIELINIV
jgi:hypothetical protein